MTKNKFIEKSKLLFGDQFNYCYVTDTVKLSDRVKLVCKENGLVEQSVSTHLRGFLPRNKSNQYHKKFIENAIKKFGDKFDYSKTEYTNRRNKVKIICEEHGEFEILPLNFLKNKYGCTKCGIRREKDIKEKKRINDSIKRYEKRKKVFFKKCYETHGDKYDYSLTKYINTNLKVKIICKKHGEFLQRESAHASGQGCMECRLEDRRIGLDLFLNRCYEIHGDRYDYSLVSEYKNSREKVKVICKKHGEFEVTPKHHTNRKQGCSICSESIGEKIISKFLYDNNIKYDREYIFNDCKNIKELRFDFYIKDLNICIEYNGIQHYEPIEHFGGLDTFINQKLKDEIKSEYCKNNNIHLIIIKYDEDILEKLTKYLI